MTLAHTRVYTASIERVHSNEDKTQGIYFSHSRRPPVSRLTLDGKGIPFVNSIKYLGVIFDKKITWRLHIKMIEAKAFRTFIKSIFPIQK
jgi:hypothetical protein